MNDRTDSANASTVIEDYLKLWEQETSPDLEAYLSNSPTLPPSVLSEILRIDLRQRWQDGDKRLVELYLETYTSLSSDPEAVLDLVYAEYLLRERDHEDLDVERFVNRFPPFAEKLRAQIELHRLTSSVGTTPSIFASSEETSPQTQEHARSRPSNLADTVADRFRLLRCLGEGGMGVVWEAEEISTGRHVALKMLNSVQRWSEAGINRLLKEGQLAASISHQRCAFVFEVGFHDARPCLVMEYLPGKSLREIVSKDAPLSIPKAVDYILDVIEGLEAAHRIGVIHRDIKPSNCLIDSIGRVKIGDFGLARLLDENSEQLGHFFGTPAFAAPEQIRGEDVTERSDQYGVGATLYYLLASRPPFAGNAQEVLKRALNEEPLPLSTYNREIPPELVRIVSRCLAKNASRRFATLGRLRQALLPFSQKHSTLANVGRRMAAYAIDLSLLFLLFNLFHTPLLFISLGIAGANGSSPQELAVIVRNCNVAAAIASLVLQFVYFVGFEGLTGAGVGKRWLSLRVVGPDAGPPGIRRGLIRTFIVPGACGLCFLDPIIVMNQFAGTANSQSFSIDPNFAFFLPILFGEVQNVVLLICLSTIRKSNGYRGLHELCSNTRTVCLAHRSLSINETIRSEPSTFADPAKSWGPYRAVRRIGGDGAAVVWEAFDDLLHRRMWVFERPVTASQWSRSRFFITRPTRLRWLQNGKSDLLQWDAFEPGPGVPYMSTGADRFFDSWDIARVMFANLASELLESERDAVLPSCLSPSQVLVHPSGHLTLLDFPLECENAKRSNTPVFSAENRALALFEFVVKRSSQGKIWPPDFHEFLNVLAKARSSANSIHALEGVFDFLNRRADQCTTIQWDDRLGLTCASLFVETMIYLLLIATSGFVQAGLAPWNLWTGFLVHLLIALSLPALQPIVLRKNILFTVLGVVVACQNGQPAGRWRIALRDFLAWLPCTLNGALIFWAVGLGFRMVEVDIESIKPMLRQVLFVEAGVALVSIVILISNAVFLFTGPARSIQDRLAGTCLFLK